MNKKSKWREPVNVEEEKFRRNKNLALSLMIFGFAGLAMAILFHGLGLI